jgi:hypothetical protein
MLEEAGLLASRGRQRRDMTGGPGRFRNTYSAAPAHIAVTIGKQVTSAKPLDPGDPGSDGGADATVARTIELHVALG